MLEMIRVTKDRSAESDGGFLQLAPLLVHEFSRCLVEAKQAVVFFDDRYQGFVLVRGQ